MLSSQNLKAEGNSNSLSLKMRVANRIEIYSNNCLSFLRMLISRLRIPALFLIFDRLLEVANP